MYMQDMGKRMRIWRLTLALVAMIIAGACACSAYNPGDPEFRAILVNAWGVGLKTSGQIDQLIADAHYCNANTIVAQVRRRGDTIYPSGEPTASGFSSSFDSLAYLIQKCHSTSPRLDIQAWFVVWPIESDPPTADPNHPYNKYPQYLTKDNGGNTNIAGEYWFDPGNPSAEQYTYNVIMDVVNRYDVDGINLDYIRYAYNNIGYNDVSVARFNSFSARYGSDFSRWRRDQVTNFVRKCYANAIAIKPNMKVTADVFCSTPAATSDANWPAAPAYCNYFQDWRAWMEEGILDLSNPMSYFECTGTYANHFGYWTCFARSHQYNRQTAMTISITGKGTDCAVQQMLQAREQSCPGSPPPAGMGIYSYVSMDQPMLDAILSVWTSPAPVPTMPWKFAPTKGHIKGNVTFAGSVWIDGASISLTGTPISPRSMIADGTGFFAFIDLPHGDYTVTCVATGYGTVTNTYHVDVGQVVEAPCDYPISSLIISNVQAGTETSTGATITWTTNAAASSKVYYGLDRTCSSSTTEDSTQVTAHSVPLTGLSPTTTYYYRVYSLNPGAPAAMSPVCALVTLPARPADIIIDNPAASIVGNWGSSSSSTDKYGADYLTAYGNDGTKTATYTPNLQTAGTYNVYEWHTQGTLRCSSVPFTVSYNGGSHVYSVNEQTGGGNWNLLGSHPFVAGTSGNIQINNLATGGTVVIADAVKFSWYTETTPPSTPTNLAAANVQDDSIILGWTASSDNVAVAGYRISRGPNSTVTVIDSSPTNAYTDTDILPNTRYYYAVSAYDTSGNKSGTSTQINVWSLTAKPSYATVTCDKQAGVWQTAGPFTFSSFAAPWGAGKVNYYRYAWDTSPTHTWLGTESTWVGGTKSCTATSSATPYYLHIRGYNQAAVPGDPADLGPYYLDSTAPGTPIVTDSVPSIAGAKLLIDGRLIHLSDKTVSAVFSDCFYVQDSDSNEKSGIRAEGTCPYAVGTRVDVGGYLSTTSAKERAITGAVGVYSPSPTSVHASWSANDPESPVIGYQYAVGTTSGGVDLVNWTTTTDTSATITIPSQSYGTMIYVSVKAQNAAMLWSEAGNSDGLKVGLSVTLAP